MLDERTLVSCTALPYTKTVLLMVTEIGDAD
jgi:hypothetical protein